MNSHILRVMGVTLCGMAFTAVAETRVVQLDENVYRVRVAKEGGTAPSSGFDRYGFLKRDWPMAKSVAALPHAFEATTDGKETRIVLPLKSGEHLYGLGDVDRSTLDRRGKAYELWVANLKSYIPIGFLFSSEGWGVFVNTTWRHFFDVGATDKDALVVRAPGADFSTANFMRASIYSSIATMKIGLDLIAGEGLRLTKGTGHGGLFKTKGVAEQILSAMLGIPVTTRETAGEGGPYGMALLAGYMLWKKEGQTLEDYLENVVFANARSSSLMADEADVEGFNAFLEQYKASLKVEVAAIDSMK